MAGTLERQRRISPGGAREASGLLALLALLAGGAALAWVLWQMDGPPQFLSGAPDWSHIREVLTGSELVDSDVIAASTTVAWLGLGYLAFAVGLRLLVTIALRISGGARWAHTGMRLSNLVTIPVVRRVVDGGVAGTLLLASLTHAPSRTALAGEPAAVVAIAPLPALELAGQQRLPPHDAPDQQEQPPERFVEYTVVRGDYLWDIARRLYGDGSRFVEIFEANRGRVMAGGEVFDDPRLIRPGWVLRVPLPALNVTVDEGIATYRVRRGDHLWGIAERFLGDGFRWVEIWEMNRGHDMGGGWSFTDPNLIYPDWLLELPLAIPDEPGPPVGAASPPAPSPTPAPSSPEPVTASPEAIDIGEPEAVPDSPGGGWEWEWPSLPRPVLVTAAGFAVIGGTALFVQRLHRAGVLRLHRRGPKAGSAGDAGRVALATKALQAALTDYGFADSAPLLVLETGRGLEFTIACPPGDGEALVALRHDLMRRLACDVETELIGQTRVLVKLSGFQRLTGMLASGTGSGPSLVVPVGGDQEGVTYLNLAAAGSVAVTGTQSERRQLLRSWLATLATTCSPDELSFRTEAGAARQLEPDPGLPHFAGMDPESSISELADELDETVQTRGGEPRPNHAVVAIVDLPDGVTDSLDSVMHYGPPAGVFVIAGIPAEAAERPLATFAVSIRLGSDGDGEEERDTPGPGEITLRVGRDEPMVLEPVHVRRDTSPRWTESAEVATDTGPFVPASSGALRHPPDEPLESGDRWPEEEADGAPPYLDPYAGEPSAVAQVQGVDHAADEEPSALDRDPASSAKADPPEADREAEAPREQTAGPAEEEHGAKARAEAAAPDAAVSEGDPKLEQSEPRRPPGPARQAALISHTELPAAEVEGSKTTPPVFTIRCLGRFEVLFGETRIDRWRPEKAREFLAFLATHGDSVPAEAIADAVWAGYPWDESTRKLIANAASAVRGVVRSHASDPDLKPVVTSRQRYQLQAALFQIDLDAFEAALRRAASLPDPAALEEYERAAAIYRGDFLEGEPFTWIDAYRSDYRQRLVDGLTRAATIAEALHQSERAARLCERILEHEPTNEEAARGRMRSLAASGDINGARKVYRALTEALQRELDDPRAGPAHETRDLLTELLAEAEGGVA